MRRKGQPDPVSPELAAYVVRRDGGCVFRLARIAALGSFGLCYGRLTAAHVRDRGKGGRLGKRPPSTARHLVACCAAHHLDEPLVDLADVRDELDQYLEEIEGPDQDDGNRPWEAIARVRSATLRNAGILATAGSDRRDSARTEHSARTGEEGPDGT